MIFASFFNRLMSNGSEKHLRNFYTCCWFNEFQWQVGQNRVREIRDKFHFWEIRRGPNAYIVQVVSSLEPYLWTFLETLRFVFGFFLTFIQGGCNPTISSHCFRLGRTDNSSSSSNFILSKTLVIALCSDPAISSDDAELGPSEVSVEQDVVSLCARNMSKSVSKYCDNCKSWEILEKCLVKILRIASCRPIRWINLPYRKQSWSYANSVPCLRADPRREEIRELPKTLNKVWTNSDLSRTVALLRDCIV